MEHVENDMDHLFQKAGELYPLKTSGSDWDALAGNLSDEGFGNPVAVPGTNTGVSRNKRKWLLLLLLIPMGIGSIIYFSSSKKQSAITSSASIKKGDIKKSDVSSIKTEVRSEKIKTEPAQNTEANNNSSR